MKKIIENIAQKFNMQDVVEQRADITLFTAEKGQLVSLLNYLRDVEGYTHLVLLTAVDWIEDGQFQLTYILNNPTAKNDLSIRVMIDREEATMETIHHLWAQAKTYQRELKEMFGIDFPGSPLVDKPFILESWKEIPPYRRDFDTKEYSEKTYFPRPGRESNDPATYMKSKLYPDE